MRVILGFILSLFFSLTGFANGSTNGLPASVKLALDSENVPLDSISIYVKRVDAHQSALVLNADMPRNPASVMKLLTSYAALDLLGPTYRWKTQFLARTIPSQGKLTGGLWVKGIGDPSFNEAALLEVASELKQKYQLEEVCCELNIDSTLFPAQSFDAAAFDGKPYRAYNAPAEAVMVNQQALRLQLVVVNDKVMVIAYPKWKSLTIQANVEAVGGECNDWKSGLQIQREGQRLDVRGNFPVSCGNKYFDMNWQNGTEYFAHVMHSVWEQVGVREMLRVQSSPVPGDALVLTEHVSSTLADVLRDMNKASNNVIARALYLSLSRVGDETQIASLAKSEQNLIAWLRKKGWNFSELVLENGAGLSRVERINATHLGLLLDDAFHSAVMPELMASLPIYGLDGSLIRRKESTLFGRAHLKTGSLENVRAIAGYVIDAKGRYWSVVFMANGDKAGETRKAQDALLTWVYQQE
jgi:D-alanyl-D-alanine carboxypeptidase/D-alanyl-D-alanine-endopeptidase (penicillin-binding protein 4)